MVSTTDNNVIIKPTTARDEVEEKVIKNRLAQKSSEKRKNRSTKNLCKELSIWKR